MKVSRNQKPEIIKIAAKVRPFDRLSDMRTRTQGQNFGVASQVAKQYGIKSFEREGYMEFVAPKPRMQMFVEKLHFSGVFYREIT
tara:strand:- start:5877 stop:6131 length:255 start_codon:yes stop_codon:yes gene_type:complete